ncbi:MAG: 3'-5' exonuclease [Thermoanaerobaculia bacterium]|nr:3'-5' exonuclease [Thermoanaerobaculia bacterium]
MKRFFVAAATFFLLSCASTAPSYLDRFKSTGPLPPSPSEAPEQWLLAFMDIETTGLVPGWHEPIDIGIVVTDLEGNEVDQFFTRIMPEHPERISPGARAVNAFDVERWKRLDAIPPELAVDSIVEFHERVAGERPVMMVAFNSQFDTAFLDHLFRSASRSWRELYHYMVLDIPSMAWSRGHRDLRGAALAEALGVADEPRIAEEHTGLTGAKLNARLYSALR